MSLSANTVQRFDKLQLSFVLGGTTFSNPYDPAQIDVNATLTDPLGQTRNVNAFYFQDYTRSTDGWTETLTNAGAAQWMLRVAPELTGNWSLALKAVDSGSGTGSYATITFTCSASSRKGPLRVSAGDSAYLSYEDGSQYIPLGQNVGWGNWVNAQETYNYDLWFSRIAAQGGNFARVWMASMAYGIEWNDTGLGTYTGRLRQAWRLDYILELGRSLGIETEVMLQNHGAVSTLVNPEWANNPYNAANGGPCATPRDFFNNASAKAYFKRRLRYVVARWGYAPNLVWELFNEVDNTDNYLTSAPVRADVAAWHVEMAAYLKSLDRRAHIVSTSFSRFQNDSTIWAQSDLDWTTFHQYARSPALEDEAAAVVTRYRANGLNKPVLNEEIGLGDWDGTQQSTNDPNGIHWHNAQWATLLAGAAGTSGPWWWSDYVDNKSLYPLYKGLSTFTAATDFAASAFTPSRPSLSGSGQSALVITGYPFWGFKAGSAAFTASAQGIFSPGEDNHAQVLYSSAWDPSLYNPPTFTVTLASAGNLVLQIAGITGSPNLVINVDGGPTEYSAAAVANSTVSLPLTSGFHSITLNNSTTGTLEVSSISFPNAAPRLKAYALQGPDTVLAWVHNRDYNWQQLRDVGTPPSATGMLSFSSLANDGQWDYQWWDTQSGLVTLTGSAIASGGALSLAVPSTTWDRALKMTWSGSLPTATPTSTISPTRTATPSSTRTASPSVTVTPSASQTETSSPSPNTSDTPSETPSITLTESVSPTFSATPSLSVSPSVSPTSSATSSATQSSSATPSLSVTLTVTPSASVSASPSATLSATVSATFTASPTALPQTATLTLTIGPQDTEDPYVRSVVPVPQPQAGPRFSFAFNVEEGSADTIELRVYSAGYNCLAVQRLSGSYNLGWNVPAQFELPGLVNGIYFITLQAGRRGRFGRTGQPNRLVVLK